MNTPQTEQSSLTLTDIVVLRQFIEKGFRENLFLLQEQEAVNRIRIKLNNIIQDVLNRSKE